MERTDYYIEKTRITCAKQYSMLDLINVLYIWRTLWEWKNRLRRLRKPFFSCGFCQWNNVLVPLYFIYFTTLLLLNTKQSNWVATLENVIIYHKWIFVTTFFTYKLCSPRKIVLKSKFKDVTASNLQLFRNIRFGLTSNYIE